MKLGSKTIKIDNFVPQNIEINVLILGRVNNNTNRGFIRGNPTLGHPYSGLKQSGTLYGSYVEGPTTQLM